MGRVDDRRMRDVLAPMFVRAVAHVDLLDVAGKIGDVQAVNKGL